MLSQLPCQSVNGQLRVKFCQSGTVVVIIDVYITQYILGDKVAWNL